MKSYSCLEAGGEVVVCFVSVAVLGLARDMVRWDRGYV